MSQHIALTTPIPAQVSSLVQLDKADIVSFTFSLTGADADGNAQYIMIVEIALGNQLDANGYVDPVKRDRFRIEGEDMKTIMQRPDFQSIFGAAQNEILGALSDLGKLSGAFTTGEG